MRTREGERLHILNGVGVVVRGDDDAGAWRIVEYPEGGGKEVAGYRYEDTWKCEKHDQFCEHIQIVRKERNG